MKDIFHLHEQMKLKKTSAVELTQECLKNANESKNPVFISKLDDRALLQAQRAQERFSKNQSLSYLDGIPFTLKDLFITQDIRTTASSKILYNYIPPYDGYVSENLQKAGGVLIGKVSCDQFGMGSTNENTPFPKCFNPVNDAYVAGGSSGASAASVKENSSYYSIGTDTGGSTRLPAHFCGIVGYKPTYGRVSRYGQIAFASSLDQAAPLANSVLDMGCIIEHITSKDQRDPTQAPLGAMNLVSQLSQAKPSDLKGKKIGYSSYFIEACDSEVKKAMYEAIDTFKKLGCECVEIDLPHAKYSVSVYYLIATSEASANLARFDGIHFGHRTNQASGLEETYIKSRTEGFGDEVKRRILIGTFSLSSGYQDAYFSKACKVRRLISNDFKEAFNKCDFILNPVCASAAFKRGESKSDPFKMYMNDLFTIPASLSGLPCLSIPFSQTKEGLPIGIQLIGKSFQDEELLLSARAFEVRQ